MFEEHLSVDFEEENISREIKELQIQITELRSKTIEKAKKAQLLSVRYQALESHSC